MELVNDSRVSAGSPAIALIVPIYNAKPYLEECLTSIRMQTFGDWECICVDDGSSDESPSIVREFADRDSRFRLIQQENRGPGAARNTGLSALHADFFTFVDADDTIHPQMLECLLAGAQQLDADLVVGSISRFVRKRRAVQPILIEDELRASHTIDAPVLPLIVDRRRFRCEACGKLYRRACYPNLEFPPLRVSEDLYLHVDVYSAAKRVVILGAELYHYRYTDGSLSHSGLQTYQRYIAACEAITLHYGEVCRAAGVGDGLRIDLQQRFGSAAIFLNLFNAFSDARLAPQDRSACRKLARTVLCRICSKCGIGFRILPKKYWPLYWGFVRWDIPFVMRSFCWARNAGRGWSQRSLRRQEDAKRLMQTAI